jgi:hypothetical protein
MVLAPSRRAELLAALLVRWLIATEGAPFSSAEDVPARAWKAIGQLEPWGGGRRAIERTIARVESC